MNLLIFLIILVLLVLVHEFGHFIVAKKFGIRVDEFGVGLPPRIFGIRRNSSSNKITAAKETAVLFEKISSSENGEFVMEETFERVEKTETISKKWRYLKGNEQVEYNGNTVYSLNALPFGGFVKIFGENPSDDETSEEKDLSRSMAHKGKWVQVSVLAAGITFNLIFAWLIISFGLMFGLPTAVDSQNTVGARDVKVVISGVMPKSPAEAAGLKAGDILLSLKTERISLAENLNLENIKNFIAGSQDPMDISFMRGIAVSDAEVSAAGGVVDGTQAIGISMEMVGILKLPVHKAFIEGSLMTARLVKSVATGIFYFLHDAILGRADLTQVAGPVGMVALVGDARVLGFSYLIFFIALISINLAVINLIPFPALDGGRLLVLLIETIKGSPIKPKLVNSVNAVGFFLLIILMLVVTFNDILKLF